MQYLLLIYDAESDFDNLDEAQIGELMGKWGAFHEELASSGVMLGANRLRPVATATTVRVRGGDRVTTDGPFAETKEQLGGYYLIDVPNLDDAVTWAAKMPSADVGSIEVRPVWPDDEY